MRQTVFIGSTLLKTKIEARQFIRKHRESGFLDSEDAAAFQAFFRTEELVCVHFNPVMRQNELYAGAKRLNSKHAIDYAFLRDNDEYSEKRLRRAHAVEKARNLVHWDGSARASWLKENAHCCKCLSTERLEVDHLRQFIDIWEEYGSPNLGFDEEDWKRFHDERATFQTLCQCCHRSLTLHRKKFFNVLKEISAAQSESIESQSTDSA